MEVNYWAVLVCGILSMVVGSLWYGPVFGKKWLEIIGVANCDEEMRKKMQKDMVPLYGVQFLLTLLQVYILSHFVDGWTDASGIETALFVWLGFIMPTVAGASMWTNESNRVKWQRFGIQAGYQLVMCIIFGYILGVWQ